MEHFDTVIIGSGQAAPALAVALAVRGERVALIEGDRLGGTCVNTGCTPTKTLHKTARVAHLMRRAGDFGIRPAAVEVDFGVAMARMRERVDTARRGLTAWLGRAEGVEARPHEIRLTCPFLRRVAMTRPDWRRRQAWTCISCIRKA